MVFFQPFCDLLSEDFAAYWASGGEVGRFLHLWNHLCGAVGLWSAISFLDYVSAPGPGSSFNVCQPFKLNCCLCPLVWTAQWVLYPSLSLLLCLKGVLWCAWFLSLHFSIFVFFPPLAQISPPYDVSVRDVSGMLVR